MLEYVNVLSTEQSLLFVSRDSPNIPNSEFLDCI